MPTRIQQLRIAFTLIELLVVLVLVGVLAGLLLPAVQAAREAARGLQCRNNLHQIALATTAFHDLFGAYPPSRYQPRPGDSPNYDCGGTEGTWLVRILPYIEQTAAANRWDHAMPYASHDESVRTFVPAVYLCPTRRAASESVGMGLLSGSNQQWITLPCGCQFPVNSGSAELAPGAVGDYGGNHGDLSPGAFGLATDFYLGGNGTGIIISSRAQCRNSFPVEWVDRIRSRDITDGLSNTLLSGEMHVPLGQLGQADKDAFIFNGEHFFHAARVGGPTVPIVQDLRDELNGLVAWGSWHKGVCNFALADGSVRAISNRLDTEALGNLCHRSDGQVVTGDD